MELLDPLGSQPLADAIRLLDWIGAKRQETDSPGPIYCIYNLAAILDETKELLPFVELLAEKEGFDSPILEIAAQAIDDIQTCIARLPTSSPLLPKIFPPESERLDKRGDLGPYPLYCLIPHAPSDPTWTERYRSYKSVLLLLAEYLHTQGRNFGRSYSSPIAAAAAALRLGCEPAVISALPDLTSLGIHETYLRLVEQSEEKEKTLTGTEQRYIDKLRVVFQHFVTRSGGHTRESGTREVRFEPDSTEKEVGKSVKLSRPIGASAQTIREARKSGLAPGELADDLEYITEDIEENEDDDEEKPATQPAKTLARQAMARQRRLEAIERNAQMLPIAPNRLAPWEQAVFLRHLKDKLTGPAETIPLVQKEAVAALAISFWLSKRLGDALRLVLYRERTNLPRTMLPGSLGYVQSTSEWALPALRPKGEPKYLDIDKTAAVPVSPLLFLPDLVNASAYLSRLPGWEAATRGVPSRAFESNGLAIETECKDILKEAKALSHGRVTRARVADGMLFAVIDESGDKATGSLVVSRRQRLGDTQLHYTEVPPDRLRKLYTEACRKVSNRAIDELREFDKDPTRPTRLDDLPTTDGNSIGCPIRPSDESIQRLARELATAVDRQRLAPQTPRFLVDFSNLYSSYVIVQLLHLLGIRAVNNPIPSVFHIDFENALLIASDKDDYTCFNTRVVPIPKILLEQLRFFLAHRRTVLSRLSLKMPRKSIDSLLDNVTRQAPPKKKSAQSEAGLRKTHPKIGLFFLLSIRDDGQIRAEPPRPTEVLAIVRQHAPWFGLPENCGRSRLRSILLERSCPGQWIDAMLGHWTRGEEPWHRFATTSIRRICDGLRDHLDNIARKDGWRAIRGFG